MTQEELRELLRGAQMVMTFQERVGCEIHAEAVYHPAGHVVERTMTATLDDIKFPAKEGL